MALSNDRGIFMRNIRIIAAAAAVFASTLAAPAFAARSMMSMAMPSCSAGDTVVWANTRTKVYHMPGTSRYGKTKHGKYVCMSQATTMGMHAAMHEGMSGSNGAMGSSAMGSSTMIGKHHKKGHGSMTNGGSMGTPGSSMMTPAPR